MKRVIFLLPICFLLFTFVSLAETITIQVSPNTLNIQSEGEVVTVHTNLPYSEVAASTVALNGVQIDSWKMDNRGYFVAKFAMDEIKTLDGLIIGDYNELCLYGYTQSESSFVGCDSVMVIDVEAEGKSRR